MTMGVTSPILLTFFQPVPLAFRAIFMFTIGLILMSIAGTGLNEAPLIGTLLEKDEIIMFLNDSV